LEVLVREGYVEITSPESCRWLKSKTCLAEYLKWISDDCVCVPGGFWAPAEKAFGIKRHSLRKLAGNNGNIHKPDESKDFKKLKPFLLELREEDERRIYERRIFKYIQNLYLLAEDEKPETIREILEKIIQILTKDE
jgi:hypothetical protein